jgi:branched-chain amino acid transport system permease protein
MVTLAVGELAAVAAGQWRAVTGGTDGLAGIPATRPFPGLPPMVDDRAVYGYVLAVAVLAVAATGLVLRSRAGLLVRGCRDGEARMGASGHRVHRYLLATYAGAGAIAGTGGSLLLASQRAISPEDVGFEVSALVLLAVTIGGAGSLLGALVAVGVVVWVQDWAAGSLPGRGPLVLGILFVAAVYAVPVRWLRR